MSTTVQTATDVRPFHVDIPEAKLPVGDPVHLPALLVEFFDSPSTSHSRALISQGAVRINGRPVSELDASLSHAARMTRPAPETASGSGKRPSRMIGRPLTNDHWMPLERAT